MKHYFVEFKILHMKPKHHGLQYEGTMNERERKKEWDKITLTPLHVLLEHLFYT